MTEPVTDDDTEPIDVQTRVPKRDATDPFVTDPFVTSTRTP